MSETSTPGSSANAIIVMSGRSAGSGLPAVSSFVRRDAIGMTSVRSGRMAAHRAQRGRMSQMRRVEAAAIDADLHLRAFFASSIFGFCSVRL